MLIRLFTFVNTIKVETWDCHIKTALSKLFSGGLGPHHPLMFSSNICLVESLEAFMAEATVGAKSGRGGTAGRGVEEAALQGGGLTITVYRGSTGSSAA